MGRLGRRAARWLDSVVSAGIYAGLRGTALCFRVLPTPLVFAFADVVAFFVHALDPRGRRTARQNLRVVYGDELDGPTRRRIVRRSIREAVRSVFVLLHAAPLTPARFRRWVEIDPADERALRDASTQVKGAVVVSAHVGSWELLPGLAGLFEDAMSTRFLVESSVHPAVDRFLGYVRGSGGARSALRKGGAQAMSSHVKTGGAAGIIADRNVSRRHGGLWIPFFGLEARTTPLPGLLARRHDVPVVPVFMIPKEDGRYRLHLAPEPSMDVRTGDRDADIREITLRLNRIIEDVVRTHPEAWNWTLKRWKSRPTKEQGAYPSYSIYEH